MNTEKIKGKGNSWAGKAKEKAGEILHDDDLKTNGTAQKTTGDTESFVGNVKDSLHKGAQVAGDNLEKVGRKIQEKGFDKTGRAVEGFGDKIEHIID